MKYECIVSKKTLGYEKELKNEHLAEKYKILKQKVLWDDSFAVVVIKNTIWYGLINFNKFFLKTLRLAAL